MMRDPFYTDQLRGTVYGLLTFKDLHHSFVRRFFGSPFAYFFQQLSQTTVQRNPTVFAILGNSGMEQSFLEIHIVPEDMPRFVYPQTGESQKTKQIRAILRLSRTGSFNVRRHIVKLRLRWQVQFFWLHPAAIYKLGRIVHAIALFNRNLKNAAHNAQRPIIARRAILLAIERRPFIAISLVE